MFIIIHQISNEKKFNEEAISSVVAMVTDHLMDYNQMR